MTLLYNQRRTITNMTLHWSQRRIYTNRKLNIQGLVLKKIGYFFKKLGYYLYLVFVLMRFYSQIGKVMQTFLDLATVFSKTH